MERLDPSRPKAVIFDIDGTLALRTDRGPFDWHRVGEDLPNEPVIELALRLSQGMEVVFLSGRDEVCRKQTEMWLDAHDLQGYLYMRPAGDNRKDSIVKRELYAEHVAPFFNVVAIFDDRNQVVRMWREELGLTCLQVAEGNF